MLKDYIRIARPDHWFKNVFILPGTLMAWLADPDGNLWTRLVLLFWAVMATNLVASSNYTINELLDADEDKKHPDKKNRPAALGRIRSSIALIEWLLLAVTGLAVSWFIHPMFFATQCVLWLQGIFYNVKPFRTKDVPYLDVLSESINNPIRFLLGWYAIRTGMIPPISLIFAYWMLGAYFMAVKRFAELRYIGSSKTAGVYRKSFLYYTEERLMNSIVFYATASALFGGIFLMRYKIELILSVPFIAGFMSYYMKLGFMKDSPAQHPEKLYRQVVFILYAVMTTSIVIFCLFVKIPWIQKAFQSTVPGGF